MGYNVGMTRWEWILALKPGDVVCTCTREHKTIAKIVNESEVKGETAMIPWIVGCFSMKIAYQIQENLKKVHGEVIEDRIVFFTDGSNCRATSCLDPVGPGCSHAG